jgi:hypothetical protein
MYSWKKMIAAIGGIGLAVTVGALVPRRSEAQYTSPVRVYNTYVALVPFTTASVFTSASADPILASATHALVIEQLSWFGTVSTGQSLVATIECTSGGATGRYYIPIPKFAPDSSVAGQDDVSAVIPVRIYCDANANVQVRAIRSAVTNANTFNYGQTFSISGYLLP